MTGLVRGPDGPVLTDVDGGPPPSATGQLLPTDLPRSSRWTVGKPESDGRRRPVALGRMLGPVMLLLLWWVLSAVGALDPDLVPRPQDVARAGSHLISTGQFQAALLASMQRVAVGMSIGVSAGVSLAVLAGLFAIGRNLFDSNMQIIKSIPSFAIAPLLIIWMGIDEGPKFLLIAISTSVPVYVGVFGAIRNMDVRLLDMARTLKLRRSTLIRNVVLPGTAPEFLVGLRLSFASAWLALIFAEQVNAKQGLAKLMSDGRNDFQIDVMLFVVVVYAVLGLGSYGLVRMLERRLLVWKQ